MKEFVKKYFNQEQISMHELVGFLTEYCEFQGKTYTQEQFQIMTQMITQFPAAIQFACDVVAKHYNIDIYKLTDKNGNYVTTKLVENE